MAFNIEIDDAVEAATSKDSFNVFEFVQGAVVPTDAVAVYTDADAALKLAKIFVGEAERAKKQAEEGASLADEYDVPDEDVVNELHERLLHSKLVFNMKGLSPDARVELEDAIKKKVEYVEGENDDVYSEAFNNALIAKSIVSVENPTGAVNTDKWTPKMVAGLLTSLYVSEQNKLYVASAELTYVGAIFDRAVSADFS